MILALVAACLAVTLLAQIKKQKQSQTSSGHAARAVIVVFFYDRPSVQFQHVPDLPSQPPGDKC